MLGWHQRLRRHESEQTPGDGERQGSPMCCSLRDGKESDTTARLNNHNCATVQSLLLHTTTAEVKKSLSHPRLSATPWTVAYQAPPSTRLPRQEYWSGLPLHSLGNLPVSCIASRCFTVWATREAPSTVYYHCTTILSLLLLLLLILNSCCCYITTTVVTATIPPLLRS